MFYMSGFMIITVAGRYWCAYLRASSQESIGHEAAADQRIEILPLPIVWLQFVMPTRFLSLMRGELHREGNTRS